MEEKYIKFYSKFNRRWRKLIRHPKTLRDGGISPTFIHYFFLKAHSMAAPIATPTAIQRGSLVKAKTTAPRATPTPIQLPELLAFFLSLSN